MPIKCTFTIEADPTEVPSSGKALMRRKISYDFVAEMDGRRHERRQHFRARGRSLPGRVMTVRFRSSVAPDWVTTATRNVGVGGAFLETPPAGALPPVGTTVSIELRLPTSDQTFTLPAVVRWASSEGGAGIQFVDVDVDVLLELNDYYSSLTP